MKLPEAEKLWKAREWTNYKANMVASYYTVEKKGDDYCVAHYVCREKVSEDWGKGRILRRNFEGGTCGSLG